MSKKKKTFFEGVDEILLLAKCTSEEQDWIKKNGPLLTSEFTDRWLEARQDHHMKLSREALLALATVVFLAVKGYTDRLSS